MNLRPKTGPRHGEKGGSYRRADPRKPHRPSKYHGSHVADQEPDPEAEDEEQDPDEEDLEQEALTMDADQPDEDQEEYGEEWEDWEEEYYEDETGSLGELKEAYAAGWNAKSRAAGARKARAIPEARQALQRGQERQKERAKPVHLTIGRWRIVRRRHDVQHVARWATGTVTRFARRTVRVRAKVNSKRQTLRDLLEAPLPVAPKIHQRYQG